MCIFTSYYASHTDEQYNTLYKIVAKKAQAKCKFSGQIF